MPASHIERTVADVVTHHWPGHTEVGEGGFRFSPYFLLPTFLAPSAAGFRLRYVILDLVDIGADNGADESATAIVNINLRNRVDVVLLYHRRLPVDDVDLAQRNLRIGSCHLLQAWRELFARAAPVCIKIDNGNVAEREMFGDVHLRAVRDHFDLLAATNDGRSRCLSLILRVFGWFLSVPISVFLFCQFPS